MYDREIFLPLIPEVPTDDCKIGSMPHSKMRYHTPRVYSNELGNASMLLSRMRTVEPLPSWIPGFFVDHSKN